MKVKNMMEDVVSEILDQNWKGLDVPCSCDICRLDVLAIALNNVTPKYVNLSRESGSLYSKAEFLNRQSSNNVLREIVAASRKVAEQPSHQ